MASYGFRLGRSAHDALRRVAEVITNDGTQWLVEADIKGFFDHLQQAHLLRFLEHRVGDPNRLRIVHRFLKAGAWKMACSGGSDEVTHRFFGRALFFTILFRPLLCDLG